MSYVTVLNGASKINDIGDERRRLNSLPYGTPQLTLFEFDFTPSTTMC